MSKDDVIKLLQKAVDQAGSQRAWATAHKLSGAYISDVLAGHREPGASILEALGLEGEMTYRRKRVHA